jgi:hypothetical protein
MKEENKKLNHLWFLEEERSRVTESEGQEDKQKALKMPLNIRKQKLLYRVEDSTLEDSRRK